MKLDQEILKKAMEEVENEKQAQEMQMHASADMLQQMEKAKGWFAWESIYQKAQKQQRHRMDWAFRAAALFFVVLLVGTAGVYAIERTSGAVLQWDWIRGEKEDDFQLQTKTPEESASPRNEETKRGSLQLERIYQPQRIIPEYRIIWQERTKGSYSVTYENEGVYVYYRQMSNVAQTAINMSMAGKKTVILNGMEGEIGYDGNRKAVSVTKGKYIFWLRADDTVEWKALMNMAASVMPVKPDVIVQCYEPTYLPEGYVLSEKEGDRIDSETMISRIYVKKKENGKIQSSITFSQSTLGYTTSIDAENMYRKDVDICGWKGRINEKAGKISLIWMTGEYVFTIHGNGEITEEELLQVAESLAEK